MISQVKLPLRTCELKTQLMSVKFVEFNIDATDVIISVLSTSETVELRPISKPFIILWIIENKTKLEK